MTLVALGINHRTAPVDIREKVAFAPEGMAAALQGARTDTRVAEIAILSTCNRTELYASTDNGEAEAPPQVLLAWLANHHGIAVATFRDCHYCHVDDDAVRHLMKVASGLDSMVLGEPQILGQMKSAYAVAQQAGTLSGVLDHVFQQVFAIAKRVRSETAIGQNPVSVAYAAVSLAQRIFSDLGDAHALLIGAGDTVELVARHLREQRIGGITVANRTLERAEELAGNFAANAILLADIPEHLHRADIVISSTASQLPVLGKGAVESALRQRKHRPMLMVDIAVPRDIEPEVARLDDVYLYTVDDLREVIAENRRGREDAAGEAERIIEAGVLAWRKQLRSLEAVDTIRAFRDSVAEVRDSELGKALQALARGQPADEVARQLAHNLTNKLLHTPTTRLKRAGEEGRSEPIRWTRELFDLDSHVFDGDALPSDRKPE
ncbi:MAG: glutamyl-tRNA reductase [Porticoccaceae bacterium]